MVQISLKMVLKPTFLVKIERTVTQQVQIFGWCAPYFVMSQYFLVTEAIWLFDGIDTEMKKAEQQIKNPGWLPGAKMWNACKVRGSLQLPQQTLSNRLFIQATTRGRNFFSSWDHLTLFLHWKQNGSEPTVGEATAPSFPSEEIRCFPRLEIVKPIL